MTKKRKSWVTVDKGVYERGVGGDEPYFLVRVRHRGHKEVSRTFPYVPKHVVKVAKASNPQLPDERYKTREAALSAALAFKHAEASTFHFYGKPSAQVANEHTLRDWLVAWVREACDLEDAEGNKLDLVARMGGAEDKKQILRHIKMADEYAKAHGQASVMDRKVVDLTKSDIQKLLSMLTGRKIKGKDEKQPASLGTKRRFIALLNTVFAHARNHWDMDVKRPWEGMPIEGREGTRVARAIPSHELEAIEDALSEVNTSVLAAIYFLRWTAARTGEMRKLRWELIQWPNKDNRLKHPRVTFAGTKTPRKGAYRQRTIDLVPGAVQALELLFDKKNGPPKTGIVFPGIKDPSKPLPRKTAYQAFVRAINRAGVPHARLHDLRHNRTTEISMSIPKAQAMEITGHSDERTFQGYTHLAEEATEAVIEADIKRRKKQAVASSSLSKPQLKDLIKDMTQEERMSLIAELAKAG